jgi:hypothetical protein
LGLGNLHPAKLGAPLVKRRVAEAAIAAQFLDRQASLGLPQELEKIKASIRAKVEHPSRIFQLKVICANARLSSKQNATIH